MQGSYVSWQWIMMQKVKRNCLKSSKLSWEFDKFWPELSRISKICTFMGCFWPKYIKFWVKKYRGFMFDGTEYWCKIWRKNDLCFQKWYGMTYFSWKTKHRIFLFLFFYYALLFLKFISQFCIFQWSVRRNVFDKLLGLFQLSIFVIFAV